MEGYVPTERELMALTVGWSNVDVRDIRRAFLSFQTEYEDLLARLVALEP